MALIDDFNGSDGDDLSTYDINWDRIQGNVGDLVIQSGSVDCSGSDADCCYQFKGTGGNPGDDQYCEAVLGTCDGTGTLGPAVRCSTGGGANLYGVQGLYHAVNGFGYYFNKWVAGSYYDLGSANWNPTAWTTPGGKVRVEAEGTTIRLKYDRTGSGGWTTATSVTDSSNTSGYVGIHGWPGADTIGALYSGALPESTAATFFGGISGACGGRLTA